MQAEPILRYWQAIEYLLPNAAPKRTPKFCWDIKSHDELPWLNKQKVRHLRTDEAWVFYVYVGLLDMKKLAERVVSLLRLGDGDYENDRFSDPAAMLAFVVDRDGFVLDGPVISSAPRDNNWRDTVASN